MNVVLGMIKSKKEYEEQLKSKILEEYRLAVENGDDVTVLLLSNYLQEVNHTLDFLNIQEQVILKEKNYYEFTFDLIGASSEYSKIKKYMTSNGFVSLGDTDYITESRVTKAKMIDMENKIKTKFPWFLQMSTKIYDAVIKDYSNVRERWLESAEYNQELKQKIDEMLEKSNDKNIDKD